MPPQLNKTMPTDYSEIANSSEELSSPPASPPSNNNGSSTQDTIHVAPRASLGSQSGNNAAAYATNGNANGEEPAKKPKRQRKPREPKPEGDPPVKVRKPRKPREPKVKVEDGAATANATTTTTPAAAATTTTTTATTEPAETTATAPAATTPVSAASQKRQQKGEAMSPAPPPEISAGLRQSTLQFQAPNPPTVDASSQLQSMAPRPQAMGSENITRYSLPLPSSTVPTPRPHSSGQNYDPIRGATITTNMSHSAQASPRINRASASPSITSLIDPPLATKPPVPSASFSTQPPLQPSSSASAPPTTAIASPPIQSSKPVAEPAPVSEAMDIDPVCEPPRPNPPPEMVKQLSKSSSSAPTPRPTRPASPPAAPKGTGSGLLSSSDLFGGPSMNAGTERKGIDIDLHIPLNRSGGNMINIAQEIAKKYGRDAINPRAAEHRARLLAVAAAANKIDGGSGADDMSVDLMSEPDGDSNVEMGGMGDDIRSNGADNTDGGKPVRKRRKKVEDYDKDDDFIDDTELAWQEQAAVAKDGFFVYSGPLVPEGQSALVESTSAPTRGSRGGRGRGRGRGAAAMASTTNHATLAEKTKDSAAAGPGAVPTSGRGSRGGRGRGTGAPRKPRVTKADRERMEAEKVDRERQAAAAASSAATAGGGAAAGGAASSLAPAPSKASPSSAPSAVATSTATATNSLINLAPRMTYDNGTAPAGSSTSSSSGLLGAGAPSHSVPASEHIPMQIQPHVRSETPQTMHGAALGGGAGIQRAQI